ncbi:hypothetical protein [Nocardia sp. NPDC002869]|uniref:hypothetical protein n=1 Tax=Nocardia sp. NPDC002869 TaxID=3161032 RepID=UPI00398D08CD
MTARTAVAGDPVAGAIVDRAAALGSSELLPAVAAAFEAARCGYQRARTLVLAGGSSAAAGAAEFAVLGCTAPRSR